MSIEHKNMPEDTIHRPVDKVFPTIAARDADILWSTVPLNVWKMALTNDDPLNPQLWLLVNEKTIDPPLAAKWIEVTGQGADTLKEILAIGNESDGSDLIMSIGDILKVRGAMVVGAGEPNADASIDLKAIDKAFMINGGTTLERDAFTPLARMVWYNTDTNYVEYWIGTAWKGIYSVDSLAEILVGGNTSGANDILMEDEQGIVIGGLTRNAFMGMDMQSALAFGFPPLTTTERDALTPVARMVIWNTTNTQLEVYNGTAWVSLHAGGGDVTGPSSATDNAITRFDSTSGKMIQNSGATIDDTGKMTVVGTTALISFEAGTALSKLGLGIFDGSAMYLVATGAAIPLNIGTQYDAPVSILTANTHRGTFSEASFDIGQTAQFKFLTDNTNDRLMMTVLGTDALQLDEFSNVHVEKQLYVNDSVMVSKTPVSVNVNASAQLKETDQSLELNNVSTSSRDAYATPLSGMMHQNSDLDVPEVYNAARSKFEAIIGKNIVYVSSAADFPDPVAGVITLDPFVTYIGDNETIISFTEDLVMTSNRLYSLKMTMSGSLKEAGSFEIRNCTITYSGTGTFVDMPDFSGIGSILFSTFYFTAAGTAFGVGASTPNKILILDTMGIVGLAGTNTIGNISDVLIKIDGMRSAYFANGMASSRVTIGWTSTVLQRGN